MWTADSSGRRAVRPIVRQSAGLRARGAVVSLVAAVALAGCATAPAPGSTAPATGATQSPPVTTRLDTAPPLVPPNYGTLKQDDIAVHMQVGEVQVRAIPLDESVIRVLAPDSYRSLRGLRESKREAIDRLAARYMLRERNVWFVSFFGLAPDARFNPGELTISVSGRDYRPLEVIPLSSGFGEQRLNVRETQSALYLFGDGVNLAQPIVVRMQGVEDSSWGAILQRIEQERALIRGRANRAAP
jgi:hypothetical protein